MGRIAGTKTTIKISAARLGEVFKDYPNVGIPVSAGFLRQLQEPLGLDLPELGGAETEETEPETANTGKRTGPQVEA